MGIVLEQCMCSEWIENWGLGPGEVGLVVFTSTLQLVTWLYIVTTLL